MPIGICPTVDFVFKLLFGNPKHSKIAIHFLNAILKHLLKVSQITFLNPIQEPETKDDKLSILDILAMDEHGRKFNIEIQTTLPSGMNQRLTYYTACLYANQLRKGEDYTSLRPVINICVLTEPMFRKVTDLHLQFELRTESGVILTEDFQVHVLQLSNLRVTEENVKYSSPLEQWAFFLLRAETLTMDDIKRILPDEVFAEAAGVLEVVAKTPEQRLLYQARLKYQRDEAARNKTVEQAREEALKEGKQEGLKEGLKEGLRDGIEKGELLGRIALLQELLGIIEPTSEELSKFDLVQLSELVSQLREQLRSRNPT